MCNMIFKSFLLLLTIIPGIYFIADSALCYIHRYTRPYKDPRWRHKPGKKLGSCITKSGFFGHLDSLKLRISLDRTFLEKKTLMRNFWRKNERDVLYFYKNIVRRRFHGVVWSNSKGLSHEFVDF